MIGLPWVWKDIPYNQITEIRKATRWEGFLAWLIFLSRDRLSKTAVAIIWTQGGLNKYVMSPKDADEFIGEVKKHMSKAKRDEQNPSSSLTPQSV